MKVSYLHTLIIFAFCYVKQTETIIIFKLCLHIGNTAGNIITNWHLNSTYFVFVILMQNIKLFKRGEVCYLYFY